MAAEQPPDIKSFVNSVGGLIPLDEIGITLVHEHLRTGREAVYSQFPHLFDQARIFQEAVTQVQAARARGVRTICDPSVMGLDRNVAFTRSVAEATGMQFIVATGIYYYDQIPPYFQWRSVDELTDAFVHDIEVGIQGTNIKAAFLKVATDAPGVTPDVEKSLRAVARAHRRTGAPILTHSYPTNQSGSHQQDIFESEGVNLSRVLIGHSGDTDDMAYLERIAERGSYLGMDRFGMDDYLPHERRLAAVAELCRRGYASQVMLSQDHVCVMDRGFPDEVADHRTKLSLTFVIDEVIPQLTELGLAPATTTAMLTSNVSSWLRPSEPY